MKKASYKLQIQDGLAEQDWQVASINSSSDWWDDEHWIMESKYHPKRTFYLCFIVDPAFEGRRFKGQGIIEVKATTELPKSWSDSTNLIASLHMWKGSFSINLKDFLSDLAGFIWAG